MIEPVCPRRVSRTWPGGVWSSSSVGSVAALATGPLWAAKSWGYYWTWDPRLPTSLLSWQIYVAYAVLRSSSGDGVRLTPVMRRSSSSRPVV